MSGSVSVSRRRVVTLVAIGVVAGGVAGAVVSQLGVATAKSPSPRPTASPSPGQRDMFGLPPDRRGKLGLLGAAGRVLHGEATVEKPAGGTETVRFQNGVISGLNGSTITVRSTDGFTSTFTVDGTTHILLNGTDGTLSKLKKDDKVRVLGVQDGSTAVAKMLMDGAVGSMMFGGQFGDRFGDRFGPRLGRHLLMHATPGQPG